MPGHGVERADPVKEVAAYRRLKEAAARVELSWMEVGVLVRHYVSSHGVRTEALLPSRHNGGSPRAAVHVTSWIELEMAVEDPLPVVEADLLKRLAEG